MIELADIVRLHGQSYMAARKLPRAHLRAIEDIAACHSPAMGGIAKSCAKCGYRHFTGFSCRNRACPRCHGPHAAQWLDKRLDEMLDAPYFHIVFTVPPGLRPLVRANPRPLYSLLMQCAANTIAELAASPKWIGGVPAVMTVLHTGARDLSFHPHVHCIVSAGGYDKRNAQWAAPPRRKYLFPTRVLGKLMRGKFLDAAAAALPAAKLPHGMYKRDWVVHCKSREESSVHLIEYLARYVYRLPLSNSRLVECSDEAVAFRYRPNSSRTWKTMRLTPHGFLDRYLQHILPKGFHAVRYWGVWAPARKKLLRRIQLAVGAISRDPAPNSDPRHELDSKGPELCPICKSPLEWSATYVPAARRRELARRSMRSRHSAGLPIAAPP